MKKMQNLKNTEEKQYTEMNVWIILLTTLTI